MKPYIIGVDPSGAYKEGKGTTGIAVLDPEGQLDMHMIIEAKDYNSQPDYWNAVVNFLELLIDGYDKVAVSLEDYVLYATSARAQINSEMETSKLIGAITLMVHKKGVPLFIRNASQVMNRWSNDILVYKNIITPKGNRYTDAEGEYINRHSLDALRHAVHCYYFEVDRKKVQ